MDAPSALKSRLYITHPSLRTSTPTPDTSALNINTRSHVPKPRPVVAPSVWVFAVALELCPPQVYRVVPNPSSRPPSVSPVKISRRGHLSQDLPPLDIPSRSPVSGSAVSSPPAEASHQSRRPSQRCRRGVIDVSSKSSKSPPKSSSKCRQNVIDVSSKSSRCHRCVSKVAKVVAKDVV